MGDDEWSVFVLRDFKTFSQTVRTNQWERSVWPRCQGGSRRRDDDDKNTRIDWDWPGKHDISGILFLFCSAVSGIDQSRDNLDNLLPPPGLMGNEVSFSFFNVSDFFYSLFPAWASDWLLFFFMYSFASCILTPPTCSSFAL